MLTGILAGLAGGAPRGVVFGGPRWVEGAACSRVPTDERTDSAQSRDSVNAPRER